MTYGRSCIHVEIGLIFLMDNQTRLEEISAE